MSGGEVYVTILVVEKRVTVISQNNASSFILYSFSNWIIHSSLSSFFALLWI